MTMPGGHERTGIATRRPFAVPRDPRHEDGVATTMARRAPKDDAKFLDTCRSLATRWQQGAPGDIGLSPQQVGALVELLEETTERTREYVAFRSKARASNNARREAMARLRRAFGALVRTIDGYARYTGDAGVYTLAAIAPPARGAPRGEPPRPVPIDARLLNGGAIEVSFEASGDGAVYEVQRQVVPVEGTAGEWATIASGTSKRWIDDCPPRGAAAIFYRARGVRPSRRGTTASEWSEPATVTFGREKAAASTEPAEKAGPSSDRAA